MTKQTTTPTLALWAQLTSAPNLFMAYKLAARGKRGTAAVADFERNLEDNIFLLRAALLDGSYAHDAYHSFYIHDPKKRLISAAAFKDRVVHHALCQVIEPFFERKFIFDSYANRIGKGSHRALDRTTQYLRRFACYQQLDIRQYFASIDHQLLHQTLAETIADEKVLALCAAILDSGRGVLHEAYEMVYFDGDDLLAASRPRGLPIGNLTSQFWANVYLNKLDHYIKRPLKCKGYVRYVDDMLLFADSKAQLHDWWQAVVAFLGKLRLTIHAQQAQPTPVRQGVTFLGFRCFPDHRRLKREKVIHAWQRIKQNHAMLKRGEMPQADFSQRLQSWVNHARYGDTWGLRCALLNGLEINAGVSA